ncbi:MAG: ABC transporter substrate binding protein [Chloroflexota bacterium]|nr:ABC transporter substrate binding protein [Chloroflexota bacterium]MDE2918640.1 ABC transporter substrate binding protein [Chloroflexota bacterium]
MAALLVALAVAVACGSPTSAPDGAAATDKPHRIFVVHSYSDAFTWTRELHQGIVEGLAQQGLIGDRDYRLQTFEMDTRINFTSPPQIEQRAAAALEALRAFEPDLLFVTDDVALKHVAVRYAEESPDAPIPTVFAGINIDPTIYAPIGSLKVPGGTITGALERIPHTEAFATARRLFPDVTRVVILADAGAGSESVRAAFQRDDQAANARPFEVLDFLLLETFEQWKRAVVNYQDKADLIAVVNFHQLRDASGDIVPPAEVIDWMVAENKLPELGLVADWARDGILVAVGNSGLKTGAYVGALGADILDGAEPATLPIVDPKQTDTSFNLARARSLGIEFPPSELAAADTVFETIGGQ